jgi:hypothetical protein
MSFICPDCQRESHHPDDEKYGYCGNCHRFTGDRDLFFKLSEEEEEKAGAIAQEAIDACNTIRNLFPPTTRGLMTLLLSLSILQKQLPGIFKHIDRAEGMIAQWIAAGEPDRPNEVMGRIRERLQKGEQNGRPGAETTGE